jgi:hypothetical protein
MGSSVLIGGSAVIGFRLCRTRESRTDALRRPLLPEGAAHAGKPPAKIDDGKNDQPDQPQPRLIPLWMIRSTGSRRVCGCGRSDFHLRGMRVCGRRRGGLGIQTWDEMHPDFRPTGGKHQHHDDREKDDHRRQSQAVFACLAIRRPRTSAEMRHCGLLPCILSNGLKLIEWAKSRIGNHLKGESALLHTVVGYNLWLGSRALIPDGEWDFNRGDARAPLAVI